MADRTPRAFVCGHPIAHSRSPLIHNFWLGELGIEGSYEKVDVAPADFDAFISALRAGAYVGGNVTIPHKEAAFAAVDAHDEAAIAIGAVNTLWMESGRLVGGNTDAYGFAANLDQTVPGWHSAKKAVVLGAGGAARAVVHALVLAGLDEISIVNRTPGRARELAERFGSACTAHGWDGLGDLLPGCDLLVNTTPIGMAGSAIIDVDVGQLPDSAIVSDIVYVPLETPLLKAASTRGLSTVDGLGMLLHQAVAGFERWFGTRPRVSEELRRHILADLEGAH